MTARDTYNKAKEEKNKATREKLKSLASKKCKVLYIKMNIKEQKTKLNKTDIYENVRKDINKKTNRPFKQKCQLQERNARNARQKKKSV